jgi:hypothetical protein
MSLIDAAGAVCLAPVPDVVRVEAVCAGRPRGGLLFAKPAPDVPRLALEPGGLSPGPAGRTGVPPLPGLVESRAAGVTLGAVPPPLGIVAPAWLGWLGFGLAAVLLFDKPNEFPGGE